MQRDAAHGNRLAGLEGLDLDVEPGRYAMGGGEHQLARQRRAGAQIAARVDHHHDGARGGAARRRRIAGEGVSGRADGETGEGGEDTAHDRR